MKRFILASILAATALSGIAPATAADAAPDAIAACLAAHPGAVTSAGVTVGDDVVCVSDYYAPSAGDDTYFWVGADTDSSLILSSGGKYNDPGLDTMSLYDWSHGFNEAWGFFGVHYLGPVPETVIYTSYDDVLGDPNACGNLTGGADVTHMTGAGADLVQCIVGNILTQGDDDTIIGVTLDATANAGTGNDVVTGDAGADAIVLGPGNDEAHVVGKGVDNVNGNAGFDTVYASPNDAVVSAKTVTP